MFRRKGTRTIAFVTLVTLLLIAWTPALQRWWTTGVIPPLFFAGYITGSVAIGVTLYLFLPRGQRDTGRRLILLLLGASLFGVAALRNSQFMLFQIEGLFFDLLLGIFGAAVAHYLIGKILGPLLFGRIWCGWACWTAMVLDQLPYKRSRGRLAGRWGWLRYGHFGLSLALVVLLWYGWHYRPGSGATTALGWFLAGNALYYILGIGLALILKDNRAFCKYACPVSVPLKLTSRFALLKIGGDPAHCNDYYECIAVCPMDIRITDYIKRGERVLSTECILCQECISACQENVLRLSFGLDVGGTDRLRERTAELAS